ncbi:hypothetical protein GALMADRAFT_133009 [Galerina marginata CBS 339.88]|uniref:REJ domain-containing protein n=1 Tax=Galerina marginata (strain CBS 339.88) TaxID=685588 RepID=A0A067TX33_GALM3|nr:hypothetical protein GALMADRAFT_133009 [Galerina marginata CBS 339.88]
MDAHALNKMHRRQFLGLSTLLPGIPLPLPTPRPGRPGGSPSSSSASTSSSASLSSSTSTSASASLTSSSSSTSSTLTTSTTTSSSFSSDIPKSTTTLITFANAPSVIPSASASPSHTTSFLQNKVLSGVVFGIAGFVGLVVLILIATFAMRRRRNKKFLEDDVSFDPVRMGTGGYHDASETGISVRGSSSTGRGSNAPEVRQAPSFTDYAPPSRTYLPPSANMASYSYPQQQQGYYNNNQQPYGSSSNWAPSAQQSNPYGLAPVAEGDRPSSSHRSQSSSTEMKFAPSAVPPPKQLRR